MPSSLLESRRLPTTRVSAKGMTTAMSMHKAIEYTVSRHRPDAFCFHDTAVRRTI